MIKKTALVVVAMLLLSPNAHSWALLVSTDANNTCTVPLFGMRDCVTTFASASVSMFEAKKWDRVSVDIDIWEGSIHFGTKVETASITGLPPVGAGCFWLYDPAPMVCALTARYGSIPGEDPVDGETYVGDVWANVGATGAVTCPGATEYKSAVDADTRSGGCTGIGCT